MPRLLLLRHAKSSWDAPQLADFDRPLNSRGRRSAPLMGRHIAAHALVPDRIVCSTARRTRETLAGLLPYLATEMDIRMTRDLYDSSASDYLDVIRAFGGSARTLLVIGHNPALQETAIDLVGTGNPTIVDQITSEFPTAALAIIDFPEKKWSEIHPKGGRIVSFFQPRELESVDGGPAEDE
ncbi:SixA phosphatase family protein [Segnochrobactrum spirostomi]|uniref:Histidine phosphatase family protein n=1 Tax=Segnochrobactrum spirostomi TaxID=2608987 RepID=A0A6A7Y139_9HYPH|nr:histidine phosphatase family protein [Segnochrobactrum spirostomi]MQT11542.1 histidine phosphatase family protein [Segnochrobactrum spirostomi]